LNWNGWRDTIECLESVRQLNYPNYLTVVVDNGSWNDSAEKIKGWAEGNLGPGHILADYTREAALNGGEADTEEPLDRTLSPAKLVLIRNEENLGFSGGNNVAIHYALRRSATVDYVFLLNNDAKPASEGLTHLVSAICNAGAGIAGAIVKDHAGKVCFAGSGSCRRHLFQPLTAVPVHVKSPEFWDSPVAHGAGMLVSRQVLEDIYKRRRAYLNEDLFFYCEELDFCFVASQAGHKTVIVRDAVICHGPVHGNESARDGRIFFYYFTRNNLLLARRLLPLPWKVPYHIAYLPLCLRRIAKRLIARQPRLAGAIAWGLLDGYLGAGGKWKYHDRVLKHCATQ
jgi:GT2 family glycosyltransferase